MNRFLPFRNGTGGPKFLAGCLSRTEPVFAARPAVLRRLRREARPESARPSVSRRFAFGFRVRRAALLRIDPRSPQAKSQNRPIAQHNAVFLAGSRLVHDAAREQRVGLFRRPRDIHVPDGRPRAFERPYEIVDLRLFEMTRAVSRRYQFHDADSPFLFPVSAMPSAGGTWVKLPGVVNNALCKDQRAPPRNPESVPKGTSWRTLPLDASCGWIAVILRD